MMPPTITLPEASMPEESRTITTELAIIGTGIAGFAAAVFALERKLTMAMAGSTGALAYTTGYLDLLGRMPGAAHAVDDPWLALEELRRSEPEHPLSLVATADIERAFTLFTDFLGREGLAYTPAGRSNLMAMTPAGTVKPTLSVPATMAAGPALMAAGSPCVIVDFHGLKGFSGRQAVANLRQRWPELDTVRLPFPGSRGGELYPEIAARSLQVPEVRQQMAEMLRQAAGPASAVGLPALLGMHRPDLVLLDLQRLSGLTLFEIPTMPPAVPGIRLRELFARALPQRGVTIVPQQKVQRLHLGENGAHLTLGDNYGTIAIHAEAVILATGRFLSGGLEARRDTIREPLLDLPVVQPPGRSQWYEERYTDPRGHAIHRAGIVVDRTFRPLGGDGHPFHPRLFAAGIILAHQDWIRSRSGAGIAIASACRAVDEAARLLGR